MRNRAEKYRYRYILASFVLFSDYGRDVGHRKIPTQTLGQAFGNRENNRRAENQFKRAEGIREINLVFLKLLNRRKGI